MKRPRLNELDGKKGARDGQNDGGQQIRHLDLFAKNKIDANAKNQDIAYE